MKSNENHLGQPIGHSLPDFRPPRFPEPVKMIGKYCLLEPLNVANHAEELYANYFQKSAEANWTYLPYGPFESFEEFLEWLLTQEASKDPQFNVVRTQNHGACGMASYLRINPPSASIEVGHIHFSPVLQKKPASTEAMYLMMKRVFELGYRRYEWKCDALNLPSNNAAKRLGFLFEGIFRQATVYKQRNRDTAWYSVLDDEWEKTKLAFEKWLDPSNFDASGSQKSSLADLRQTT